MFRCSGSAALRRPSWCSSPPDGLRLENEGRSESSDAHRGAGRSRSPRSTRSTMLRAWWRPVASGGDGVAAGAASDTVGCRSGGLRSPPARSGRQLGTIALVPHILKGGGTAPVPTMTRAGRAAVASFFEDPARWHFTTSPSWCPCSPLVLLVGIVVRSGEVACCARCRERTARPGTHRRVSFRAGARQMPARSRPHG